MLRADVDTIAVGVLDTGTSGDLLSPPDQRMLRFADGARAGLDGTWRYHISAPLDRVGRGPLQPWSGGLAAHFNGMIAPMGAYNLRRVAWYQGESNVDDAAGYARLLRALMADWRARIGAPTLPFLIVQLPNFGAPATAPQSSAWAELRETQRRVAANDPHAALIVSIDLGDRFDIHPTNKQEIGRHLALAARSAIYGENFAAFGPAPTRAARRSGGVEIVFAHAADGLDALGAADPLGFELCDNEHRCRYVEAKIQQNSVRLTTGASGRFIRYCWADSPLCNLANSAQLPGVPFELPLP